MGEIVKDLQASIPKASTPDAGIVQAIAPTWAPGGGDGDVLPSGGG